MQRVENSQDHEKKTKITLFGDEGSGWVVAWQGGGTSEKSGALVVRFSTVEEKDKKGEKGWCKEGRRTDRKRSKREEYKRVKKKRDEAPGTR